MAAHALARKGAVASVAAALASLSPALASACPYCAGRSGGSVVTGIVLASFVLLPFLVAWIVYRVIRAEARTGDASMLDVAEDGADRPIRRNPRTPLAHTLLHNRLRREAE